jgi:hypothetical protein
MNPSDSRCERWTLFWFLPFAASAFFSGACSSDEGTATHSEKKQDAGRDSSSGGSAGTGSVGTSGTGGVAGTGGSGGAVGGGALGAAGNASAGGADGSIGSGGSSAVDAGAGSGGRSGADGSVDSSGAGGSSGADGGVDSGGSGGTMGSADASSDAGGGDGGPPNCQPVQFRAHGQAASGDTTPFSVPAGAQSRYQCFYFRTPWNVPVHALSFKSLHESPDVIHGWRLYVSSSTKPDGSVESCIPLHPDDELLAGWARGGDQQFVMPSDVGIALPPGPNSYFLLEVHYYNATGAVALDRSGVEVCATSGLKRHTATTSWLGTQSIIIGANSQGTAGGICTPNKGQAATILGTWPVMHRIGRRMRTVINRADGGRETLMDVPNYDFDNQRGYPANPPVVVNLGDTLTTTCEYVNDTPNVVTFGPNLEQEQCFNLVLAYPARALTSSGLMANSCEL